MVYAVVERGGQLPARALRRALSLDACVAAQGDAAAATGWGSAISRGGRCRVLADGAPRDTAAVAGGGISIDPAAASVQAGLPFAHVVEPLPADTLTPNGARTGPVRLVSITFRLLGTGSLSVDLGRGTKPVPFRRLDTPVLDAAPPLFTGDVTLRGLGWSRDSLAPLWRDRGGRPAALYPAFRHHRDEDDRLMAQLAPIVTLAATGASIYAQSQEAGRQKKNARIQQANAVVQQEAQQQVARRAGGAGHGRAAGGARPQHRLRPRAARGRRGQPERGLGRGPHRRAARRLRRGAGERRRDLCGAASGRAAIPAGADPSMLTWARAGRRASGASPEACWTDSPRTHPAHPGGPTGDPRWPSTSASATSRRACSTWPTACRRLSSIPSRSSSRRTWRSRGRARARHGLRRLWRRQFGGRAVSFVRPPAAGAKVVLRRQLVMERVTDYQPNGVLRANTLNDELDRQMAALQELREGLAGSLRQGPGEVGGRLELPVRPVRANRLLGFDSTGDVDDLLPRRGDAVGALPRRRSAHGGGQAGRAALGARLRRGGQRRGRRRPGAPGRDERGRAPRASSCRSAREPTAPPSR